MGLGGGFSWARTSIANSDVAAVNLFDISLLYPINRSMEIQIHVPLLGCVLNTFFVGPYFTMDAALKMFMGDGSGYFIAPGLALSYHQHCGFAAYCMGVDDWQITFPFGLGYEWPTATRDFGFSLAAKPHIGLNLTSKHGEREASVTGGFVIEMGFNFYVSH